MCYLIAFLKGEPSLKFLFLYISASAITEIFSYLIVHDWIRFMGEKTNAPFYFFFIIAQFIAISFFYKSALKKTKFIVFFNFFVIFILLLTLFPYLMDYTLIMTFTPWAAFITFPVIIFLSSLYFIDLLDLRKGYPYANIGIFLSLGCSLINFVSFGFQDDVNSSIQSIKQLLHILPLICLHVLFLYQCLLFFKYQIKQSTMLL